MGRRRKVRILENVEMTGIADKGKALGRHDNMVVFVKDAVPGDVVNVRVTKKRKGYMEGNVQELLKPSEDRVEPFCEHFGVCGGCKWQNLQYEKQLEYKQQVVKDAMERIGKLEDFEFMPIVGCDQTTYHRNKLEYTFSSKRWLTQEEIDSGTEFERRALGYHRPGGFNKIVDINKCFLQADPSNAIRDAIKAFAIEHDYEFYNPNDETGYLRNIIIRLTSINELMLIFSLKYEDQEKREKLLDFLLEKFPQITSMHYVINPKVNDFIMDLDIKCYKGRGHIFEYLKELKFKISPKSFFQTNSAQAVVLYDKVVEFAELTGTENVYDLYTGTGSIACYLANAAKQVVGIEEIEAAIEDAKINASINEIDNTVFYAGDVKDILTPEFAAEHGKPDVLITDPPRAGMHPKVLKMLLELRAPKIVYVSCNPATQARDFTVLGEAYDIVKLQPVDMFPHTHHIETVSLLKLKENG